MSEVIEELIQGMKDYIEEKNKKRQAKNPKLGHPKYKQGDVVEFTTKNSKNNETDDSMVLSGKIYIVDAWGTFEQSEEVSYDIMVDDYCGMGRVLFKHIRESALEKVEEV